ncbi:MAG: OmpA family protein [Deltaproteobacteria bacterium]|nr:OmpA family protein [Deltaproteobacteria bacterium]
MIWTLALLFSPEQHDQSTPALYLGAEAGAHVVLGRWDLHEHADFGLAPNTGAAIGGRVGFQPWSWLALEAKIVGLPYLSDPGKVNLASDLAGDLVLSWPGHTLSPFLLGGAGGYSNLLGDHGSDFDLELHGGVGARWFLNGSIALRLEARLLATDSIKPESKLANNLLLTFGLDGFVWRFSSDRDGDGIDNAADVCPDVPGEREASGCPDRDRDSTADTSDLCPDERGSADHRGCPDSDRDGLSDPDDSCPANAGRMELRGCPDVDLDGVADAQDACPRLAGSPVTRGCPDADQDSVLDQDDRCPSAAGPTELLGCPDRDLDRVADVDDRCGSEPGTVENGGCPIFAARLSGIQFETGKAQIRESSIPTLLEVTRILTERPRLRVVIEGHTDEQGTDVSNLELSRERASAVRDFLVSRGVAAARLEVEAFGETRPLAPNSTAEGRANNRRIEFRVIEK